MKRVIRILPIIILLSCLVISCEDEENKDDNRTFQVTVINETCTSWNFTENGNVIASVNGRDTFDDANKSTSFTAEKGEHTYIVSPEPETCFFSGFMLGYQYGSGDLTINIDSDLRFEINTLGQIWYFKE